MRALLPGVLLLALLAAPAARAQVETREGIALQNQILQLRQEVEILRRNQAVAPPAASGGGSLLGGSSRPPAPPGVAPQGELVGSLLERVQRLEEESRANRGRAEEAEFRNRQLQQRVEKLEGDLDFRLRELEGQRAGAAPVPVPAAPARPAAPPAAAPAAAPPAAAPAGTPVPPPPPPAPPAPRTPQRALSDGQAALARRDFPTAEAAAREVIATRDSTRAQDAQILLGDALMGRRDFPGAAVAYDDGFRRNQQAARAPEAMLGVAAALLSLDNRRDACAQLNDLRSRFPALQPPLADRVAETRRRAQCG